MTAKRQGKLVPTVLGLCAMITVPAAGLATSFHARTIAQLPVKFGQYLAASQKCSDEDDLSVNGLVVNRRSYNGMDFEVSVRRITQLGANKFRISGVLRVEETRKPFSEVWTVIAPDRFLIQGATQAYRWCKGL